jgi:hypothetical protein
MRGIPGRQPEGDIAFLPSCIGGPAQSVAVNKADRGRGQVPGADTGASPRRRA